MLSWIDLRGKERRSLQKQYHDRRAGEELSTLTPGQVVRVQDKSSGRWNPAVVSKVREEPRSYEVQTLDGTTLRRNRSHIRESVENTPVTANAPLAVIPEQVSNTPVKMQNRNLPEHFETSVRVPQRIVTMWQNLCK